MSSLVSRRAAFEEALRQQEAAAAAYESAMGTTQKALTDYGAACSECDFFDRKASTVGGIVDIIATGIPIPVSKWSVVRSIGRKGIGVNQFSSPWGIAVHPSGVLIVADLTNNRLQMINQDGTFLRSIGNGQGSGANQFSNPSDVVILPSGNIVVCTSVIINCKL